MSGMYVQGDTQEVMSVASTVEVVVRDVAWFKQELIEAGVCGLEIVWGDYKTYFLQVPAAYVDRYLKHRRTLLHKAALAVTLFESAQEDAHPFA